MVFEGRMRILMLVVVAPILTVILVFLLRGLIFLADDSQS